MAKSANEMTGPTGRTRRAWDRQATEADLLRAVWQLLRRDGVLAGLNLREVADLAGVNRGLVYRYFGSRREILRAALREMSQARIQEMRDRPALPFRQRRRRVFSQSLARRDEIRLAAMLALDGETELGLFPALEEAKHELATDIRQGELPKEADTLVMHALTAATYLGYCVFREAISEELDIPADDLDSRALQVFDRMLEGCASS